LKTALFSLPTIFPKRKKLLHSLISKQFRCHRLWAALHSSALLCCSFSNPVILSSPLHLEIAATLFFSSLLPSHFLSSCLSPYLQIFLSTKRMLFLFHIKIRSPRTKIFRPRRCTETGYDCAPVVNPTVYSNFNLNLKFSNTHSP
jgi:hypothetical protein